MQTKQVKLVIFLGIASFFVANICSAQCNYYYLQNNKTITLAIYDKKGAENGKYVYKVSGLTKSGSTSTARVQSAVYDKKGNELGGGKGSMQCKNGQLMVDMKMMMNPQQASQFNDAEVDGKGVYLEYPFSMTVGQTLNDADFDMDVKMRTGINANVKFDIANRKVEAKESITTPAGTWDAYKITSDQKMVMSIMPIPFKMHVTEWFVPNFGVVRTESKWGKTELVSVQ